MSKYNSLKILKKVKARTNYICSKCGQEINQNDIYYKEHINDKFLHSLHAKKYCLSCYKKYDVALLKDKSKL
ncbi:hypothetical protein KJ830_01635 [bacterium]|nr:hypothetical protein [bacterium]